MEIFIITPCQLIQEFKLHAAISKIIKDNINERGNIIFHLQKADGTVFPYLATYVNALEALCFIKSILTLTSSSQEQLEGRDMVLQGCIKIAYNKMKIIMLFGMEETIMVILQLSGLLGTKL